MTKDEPVLVDKHLVPHDRSCAKNTAKWTYLGAITGTGFSGIMALHADPRLTYAEIAGRQLVRVVFPYTLVAATFGATTCMIDDLRGKDKPFSNAFLGGAAAGLVLACAKQHPIKIAERAFVLGVLAAFARFLTMNCTMVYDPKAELERVNNSLYMSNLEHLKPPSMQQK